ncbi:MAG: hypothetical protein HFH59_10010 [Lachnospiraceae bacterium]|nr:hypothetical protein [Lachnospiraceae bacterium]
MITSKENLFLALEHKKPEWVPSQAEMIMCGGAEETFENGPLGGGKDGFGVEWIATRSSGGQGTPAPNQCQFEDVAEWEDKVVFPDLDAYDWESAAKAQLAAGNPEIQLVEYQCWNWSFLRLTHLMGFENALCAMIEDPEACLAFFDAVADYKIRLAERAAHYFKPDMITSFDDVATERGLFMAPDVYRELIKPSHTKVNQAIREMGILPAVHCCGNCEEIIPDFIDEGNVAWSSAQPVNDIEGILRKYGDKITVIGGYDTNGKPAQSNASLEEIKAEVHRAIDAYAPYGSYVFFGFRLVDSTDPEEIMKSMMPIFEEAKKYGKSFYSATGK